MLGYPYGQKGYRLLDLSTKKVFVFRNVQFLEYVSPFKDITVSVPYQLFTNITCSEDDPLHLLPGTFISPNTYSEPT